MVPLRCDDTGENAQLGQLGRLERAPARALNTVGGDGPVLHADEALHLVADSLHHAVHLAVASLGDGELDPRVLAVLGDAGARDDGLAESTVELDAVLELRRIAVVEDGAQLGVIRLRHGAARMHEAVGEVAIVREQENALGVEVEATHRVDARPVLR